MKEIDLAYRTMFAELGQRSLDGMFETDFPAGGRFVAVPVKGRSYHLCASAPARPRQRLAGGEGATRDSAC
ncbi:protein of unknown function [Methylorubrum extorquens DM4]|uniref:Uncharacterized protein n=1 Tax=Methylorubrum extorquens (strain DSM 6343 / CIP 106787 / DM4) TaxID=661410 RepID=C7CFY2_METED|nr:hypothetical protein [Methylorubrum extorquens]CAX23058.1 protein of unknown function [Methylorubrum extorquens DM4]